jgi:DNA-binding IclR family transcriptional regulator
MPANVVDLLRAKGGRIEGGQRGIGKLLGVGKSRAHEILHELAAAGAVILNTSKAGTTVQLAAA